MYKGVRMIAVKFLLKRTKLIFLAIAVSLGLGFTSVPAAAAVQASCVSFPTGAFDHSSNAIITDGSPTIATIQKTYAADATVRAVYNYFGVTTNDVNNLCGTAVAGRVYRNGDVYVGSQWVARVNTTGRNPITWSTPVVYNGSTFYIQPTASFAADSTPAYIVMQNGHFRFGIASVCGNILE
jgi:hypothetical protein